MLKPYGTRTPRPPAALDRWLDGEARLLERHAMRLAVSPALAFSAIQGVRLRDIPATRALLSLRGIPFDPEMTLRKFFSTAPFLLLEEDPSRELVFGIVGPFWELRRGRTPRHVPASASDFLATVRKARMVAIANFRADATPNGTLLWTETWVRTAGTPARIAFAAYWLLIGPFSAWIRRMLLRAARKRAAGRIAANGESG